MRKPGSPAVFTEGDAYLRLPIEERQALVAEAHHTFSEEAARQLAEQLSVAFEDCAEAIERLRYRLQ